MTLNQAIETYLQQDAAAKTAAKAAKAAKEIILAAAGTLDTITTDIYTVYVKESMSSTLDTRALYKDFPDIKNTYGKTTVSRSIDVHENAAAAVKTA